METKKKKIDPGCAFTLGIVILYAIASIVIGTIKHFQKPGAVAELLDTIKALGICLGLIVVGIAALVLYGSWSSQRQAKPRIIKESREYKIRAGPILLETTILPTNPQEPPQRLAQQVMDPIDLWLCMTNYGILIRPLLPGQLWMRVPAENLKPSKESAIKIFEAIIILPGGSNLHFALPEGTIPRETQKYFPRDGSYTDLPPAALEHPLLKAIIEFERYEDGKNPGPTFVCRQPMRLIFQALNARGQPDAGLTSELYKILHKYYVKFNTPDPGDDDSWMYRSRPSIWPFV